MGIPQTLKAIPCKDRLKTVPFRLSAATEFQERGFFAARDVHPDVSAEAAQLPLRAYGNGTPLRGGVSGSPGRFSLTGFGSFLGVAASFAEVAAPFRVAASFSGVTPPRGNLVACRSRIET